MARNKHHTPFVGVRIPAALLRRIDAFALDDLSTRSAAIRSLIEQGLAAR